jgi:hypothetical protein
MQGESFVQQAFEADSSNCTYVCASYHRAGGRESDTVG